MDEDISLVTVKGADSTEQSEKSLLQLVEEAEESEPLEAQKLRRGEPLEAPGTVNTVLKSNSSKLTKEAKCELAVMAVKRAFSQCPNLSLLVSPHGALRCIICTSCELLPPMIECTSLL